MDSHFHCGRKLHLQLLVEQWEVKKNSSDLKWFPVIIHSTLELNLTNIVSSWSSHFSGIAGNPADLVNVRMQNDGKLPIEQRRHYKHAIDGLIRITKEGGIVKLFDGVGPNIQRAMLVSRDIEWSITQSHNQMCLNNVNNFLLIFLLFWFLQMTASQLASYDTFKSSLKTTFQMNEGIPLHFTASLAAGLVMMKHEQQNNIWNSYCILHTSILIHRFLHVLFLACQVATLTTAPVDVVKTRLMTGQQKYNSAADCAKQILKNEGPLG